MNDNVIINTISKIHFIIISALSFIFLVLFTTFILLQNGIFVDDISFQKVKVKQLYIKWDEKISLNAKELIISQGNKKDDIEIDYKKIIKNIKRSLVYTGWFKNISIEKISYKDTNAKLKYIDDKKGFLYISSPTVELNASLYKNKNSFSVTVDELKALGKKIRANGEILFEMKKDLELSTSLNVNIDNDTKLNIHVKSNTKKLFYKIESNKDIDNPKEIVDLFNVNPKIKYWIYDAIEMSSLSLKKFYGQAEYKNLDKAYLNLHVEATANNLKYTYNKKLAPVLSQSTELEFKGGVLYIKPKNAYSYNFFLDKSWLKIDFSKRDELLTLYLLFKGQVNSNMLYLLNNYKVKLPFTQTKGDIDTDLKLDINLQTLDVNAIGNFYTKEAQIEYLGLDIDVFDTYVVLNNSDVKVSNMSAKYKDIAHSHVDLDFNARESKGKLVFNFEDINLQDGNLTLAKNKKGLKATYIISPKGDLLDIDKSIWKYGEKTLNLESMQIPFDIKTLKAKIPQTFIEVPKLAAASISGDIFFNLKEADLNLNILKFNYNNIEFDKPDSLLKIKYKDNLTTVL